MKSRFCSLVVFYFKRYDINDMLGWAFCFQKYLLEPLSMDIWLWKTKTDNTYFEIVTTSLLECSQGFAKITNFFHNNNLIVSLWGRFKSDTFRDVDFVTEIFKIRLFEQQELIMPLCKKCHELLILLSPCQRCGVLGPIRYFYIRVHDFFWHNCENLFFCAFCDFHSLKTKNLSVL